MSLRPMILGYPENMLISGFRFYQRIDRQSQVVRIYTDRSIYRPGQTVHAAIIAFNKVGHEDAQPPQGRNARAETPTTRPMNCVTHIQV